MTTSRKPARVISPAKVISKELEARGWTQMDLAAMMDCSLHDVDEIIKGSKQITPDLAQELALAFGTTRELWMNLEFNYRKYLD